MTRTVRLLRAALACLALTCVCAVARADVEGEGSASNLLAAYVARADSSFTSREVASGRLGDADWVEYIVTSQTWRGIAWKHQLFILRPANMSPDVRQGLLFIHGGRWRAEYEAENRQTRLPGEALLFVALATSIGAPVAILRQVPFAPLFDRTEDALIAYTFDQYLKTGEDDWPLLLPMVKSAVRAMDVVQARVKEKWAASLDAFTVTGASKRGWTTWLTAANDARVKAIAPMVIDVLNMPAQMAHQRDTWGDLSEQIGDYSALDLPAQLETERGKALLSMVDPYRYRNQLTAPKLILLSTNDRYWPLDALRLYWPELPDPKRVLYVPNQGHSLDDIERVVGAISAVHRYSASGRVLPHTEWSFESRADAIDLEVKSERAAERVLMWRARSATRDFRNARWSSQPCRKEAGRHVCSAARASQGYTAAYAETAFRDEGRLPFSTSTTVCIVGPAEAKLPRC